MQDYFTVAFPEISAEDMRWVQQFREQHDPLHATLGPHFTVAFGIRELPEDLYLSHVAAVARSSRQIHFSCRYAMLGAGDGEDTAYVFLVPDEGNAAISRLHDRIYAGPFKPFLKLELPYVPHISIASMKDFGRARALCDELNHGEVRIEGRISSLTPGNLKGGRFQPFRSYPLAAS